mmetsp:Transcript_21583/g.69776  ORF Transcript_21583/g.69776 Transcript_21583/m.69776 type:complete len:338 (+) Transcript_21583:302-1315(+)
MVEHRRVREAGDGLRAVLVECHGDGAHHHPFRKDAVTRHRRFADAGAAVVVEPRPNLLEHLVLALNLERCAEELVGAVRHRELEPQGVHLPDVEVHRHPPCEARDVVGHLGCDVRVAVAVAAHPRSKLDGRRLERQRLPAVLFECAAHLTEHSRDAVPKRLLHDVQSTASLVDGGWLPAAQLVRLPQRGHLANELRHQHLPLLLRQIAAIVALQERTDPRVLVLQRSAIHLGWVRREHNLHIHVEHRVINLLLRHPLLQKLREHLLHRLLPSRLLPVTPDAVVRLRYRSEREVVRADANERDDILQVELLYFLLEPLLKRGCRLLVAHLVHRRVALC